MCNQETERASEIEGSSWEIRGRSVELVGDRGEIGGAGRLGGARGRRHLPGERALCNDEFAVGEALLAHRLDLSGTRGTRGMRGRAWEIVRGGGTSWEVWW